ncbi:glycosyltransferase [Pelagicoccus sp. SDUM812003]|uniref:glycosyltransferase n=1 Tax=Pelagicoccus sp. SDUM812003 TaxID=3041267 RepID=UPI00280FE301|nr:glycosyltransferase [Pelagicoccus sp. SDUM812003]MDQ8202146.1 glycosyltransferase [Pelagicoccus sp. SDUM812003]
MRILYVTTSFPVFSETFLQREVRALLEIGAELDILSLHKGSADFEGHPVRLFSKWSLLTLFIWLPWWGIRKPRELVRLMTRLNACQPASLLNLFENLLGFGAALVDARTMSKRNYDCVHCVWSGGPAAYGMLLAELTGLPFSTGAHAYDVFEHGGDWLLEEKLARAALVHTSTDVARKRIRRLCDPAKARLIRRGLNRLPAFEKPRLSWPQLRIVCVARLVEKKGFPYQVAIYRALLDAGVDFEARIIGDGPLEDSLRGWIEQSGLGGRVFLMGRVGEAEVMRQLEWADLLFHTGVVAASGDRDGLPNVIPEAMASGAIVIASPVSGVVEAIANERTGLLRPVTEPEGWVAACRRLQVDRTLRDRLARSARDWVEREFVAKRNSARLLQELSRVLNIE